jgi:hypothetical protein
MRQCLTALLSLAALTAVLAAASPQNVSPNTLIIQFNGKAVEGVEANTKNKEFRPVFEKELAKLAEKLPGKPELKITHWYTIINGGAVGWKKGTDETLKKTKEALEKLPYIKSVEYDQLVKPGI